MTYADFLDDFHAVEAAGHTSLRAAMLVSLAKRYDLCEPQYRDAVQRIAAWVTSPDPGVRQEVMFAVCYLRPVPGFEWLLVEGWRRADPLRLHWYAGAIECALDSPSQIDPLLVLAVVDTLLLISPGPPAPADDLAAIDREFIDDMRLDGSARALEHLGRILGIERLGPCDRPICEAWELAAKVLHAVLRRSVTEVGAASKSDNT